MIAGRTLKEWYIDNKEAVLDKNKKYRNEHKEELAEINSIRKKIKVECECGTFCNIGDKHKHIKSKKHFVLLAKKI